MTKNQYAWSVRGVSRDARNQAKNAARERHVTTGEWVSLALVTVAESELVVSPKSLLPIGPSPIASSVNDQTLNKMDARERALLALASKRPAPKSRAAQEQQSPWSIRGVSQLARIKAAQVAAHHRVTIGEWVNHAILVFASQEAGIEPTAAIGQGEQSFLSEVPEKTMRLVETLARHFDKTRTSDKPEKITPDTIREVENAAVPDSPPVATPPITPTVTPTAAPRLPADSAVSAEQKISELTYQVLGAERRNEQRLAALTEVLTTLAERLEFSGEVSGREGLGEPLHGAQKDADTL
ncbi:MAG: hypothetical protein IIB67_10810, partial [Proteobacteria bacterium]|nr:hypothetical protein [Pseudomonadota bacterium]